MEEKLRSYHEQSKSAGDEKQRACIIQELLLSDLNALRRGQVSYDNESDKLDAALKIYFRRREHRYAIRLLNHFIEYGNIDMDNTCDTEFHHPERYQRIKDLINEFFIDNARKEESIAGAENENGS